MSRARRLAVLLLALAVPAVLAAFPARAPAAKREAAPSEPPPTAKRPVTDTYHGVAVRDDYQWLENWDDPEVRRWSEAQNAYARARLDAIPSAPAIRARLTGLLNATSPDYSSLQYRGGILFAMKDQPPLEQPFLVRLKSPSDIASERVVVDPNRLDAKGGTAIDFYVPSLDGKLVAVSLSQGGSEDGTLSIYETATGKKLPDTIERVNYGTAGGSVAWNADGTGFYYTRYPRKGEREGRDMLFYQQVWFHRLGTPVSADRYSAGKEFPRIAEIALQSSDDGRYLLASVENGDGGEFMHHLLGPAGTWKQIAGYADKIEKAKFGPDGALYLLSRKEAPKGRILRLAPASPSLEKAEAVADQGDVSIQDFEPAAETLVTVDMAGGPSQMRLFDLKPFHRIADAAKPPVTPRVGSPGARELGTVPILPVSSVGQVLRLAGDELLYRNQSYVEPPAWYRYRAGEAKAAKTALKQIPAADYADTEVVREFATSKDGTKIPVNILRRRGTKLDGSNPTILYGYGGYGVNITPRFSETRRVWIEQGGVFAVANLRGGGEYGEEWHLAGNLTKKQNVFDDFTAAAKHLVDSKYTGPGRLAIEGGSNGGLLMGAALTQHPAMFRAVVSHVGIYDSLRVELAPNGEFNTTEFGTVKNPDHFKALRAYSPYHNVHDGTQYPAVLFLTGANDPRVDPSNSRKMTARLQAANVSGLPVLLRTSMTSGHGIGSALSEEIAQQTDVYAFLFDQLGMEYKPVPNTGK